MAENVDNAPLLDKIMDDETSKNDAISVAESSLVAESNPRKKLRNIFVMSTAFMLLFTAFNSTSFCEIYVLQSQSVRARGLGKDDSYYSLTIIYVVFAASNWIAPSIVETLGVKWSMIISALAYCSYIASFIYPMQVTLYAASVLAGIGAAVIWTAQGKLLTMNSTKDTINRNASIFWTFFTSCMLWGNLFFYSELRNSKDIEEDKRILLFSCFTVVGVLGTLVLFLIVNVRNASSDEEAIAPQEERLTVKQTFVKSYMVFKDAVKLFVSPDMLMLSFFFAFTGAETTFYSGIYESSVGFTKKFGPDTVGLVGLTGLCVGVGEIAGGVLLGIFGSKSDGRARKYTLHPDTIIIIGVICNFLGLFLTFINLPWDAPFGDTYCSAIIGEPSEIIALFVALLLGFADACFITQLMSFLSKHYEHDSAAAFALFKFIQSLIMGGGFFLSSILNLRWQILITVAFGFFGVLFYFHVKRRVLAR